MQLFSLAPLLLLITPTFAHAAPASGTLYLQLDDSPTTLNPITSTDGYSQEIFGWTYDTLLNQDENTFDYIPGLAEKWDISKDGKVLTFKLRPGVKWSDGEPFTADDVKYSFDALYEGRFQAPSRRVYIDSIKEIKILDPLTIQFTMKETYFKSLDVITGSYVNVVPKHLYSVGDPADPKFNKLMVTTGPYLLDSWEKGQKLVLKHNPGYWGDSVPYFKDRNRFEKIVYRIVTDETVAMEMLKKGDFDYLDLLMHPDEFVKDTQGPEWGKTVFAVKAENLNPKLLSYNYVGWNLSNPLFKDRKVRVALAHLINRDLMNEKFRYGLSMKAHGPFGEKSILSSPKVKPIEYDPKAALKLLQAAGWKLGPTGLTKTIDGKETPFEFTILCANPAREKYLTVMKEDMAKVGITLNIKLIEWNTFMKAIDDRHFDATVMTWQNGDLENDPTQIWHSKSIPSPGSNYIGYSNPEVDALIDKMKVELNQKKRIQIGHKIDELIAADAPYAFLFNERFYLYGNSNRVHKDQDTLKYAVGVDTWTPASTGSAMAN